VDFGLVLLHSGADVDGERILAAAAAAEEHGLDSVWVYDHLLTPVRVDSTYPYAPDGVYRESADEPFYDPLALIGVLTTRTRLRVGAEVFVAPYRHPIVLAKTLATFERFAPGRIVCGLGAGWMLEEFDAVGVPFARRGARLVEYVRALRAVWSGAPNAFDGEFYRWPDAGFLPAPTAPIPIVLGGHADVALRRAARIADGFAAIAGPGETGSPAEFDARLGRIRRHVEEAGRDPATFPIVVCELPLELAAEPDPDRVLVGPPEALAERITALQSAGAAEILLTLGGEPAAIAETLARFAADVRPLLPAR
jgi:probable F420-dependent oxidoreductase